MTLLSLLKGKVLAFLTYRLHFCEVWAELGDAGETGATSGFPFLLAGFPRRTPPPGLMSWSLTPRDLAPGCSGFPACSPVLSWDLPPRST